MYKQVEKQYGNETRSKSHIVDGKQQAHVIERRTDRKKNNNNNKNGKLVHNAKIIEKSCFWSKWSAKQILQCSNQIQCSIWKLIQFNLIPLHSNPNEWNNISSLNDDESDNVVQNWSYYIKSIEIPLKLLLDISTSADWKECQSGVHLVFTMISLTQFTIE